MSEYIKENWGGEGLSKPLFIIPLQAPHDQTLVITLVVVRIWRFLRRNRILPVLEVVVVLFMEVAIAVMILVISPAIIVVQHPRQAIRLLF